MAVETKNGWIFAVRELEANVASGAAVPVATTTVAGKVKQITFTAQQVGDFASLTAVTAAYNALLTKLIAAGIMPAA
jgi:hypothetical protein